MASGLTPLERSRTPVVLIFKNKFKKQSAVSSTSFLRLYLFQNPKIPSTQCVVIHIRSPDSRLCLIDLRHMAPPRGHRGPPLFDRKRFRSLEAETRFQNLYARRTVRVEKNVIMADFEHTPIPHWFEQLGWTSFLHAEGEVYLDLVREFYSNIYEYQVQSYSFRTFVRGHDITVDLPTLYEYMGVPAPLPDAYPPLPTELSYSFGHIATMLCGKPREWLAGYLFQNELIHSFRLLNLIVSANINPRGHSSDINQERGYELFAISEGLPIDLCKIFLTAMLKIPSGKKNDALPYGLFISNYLRSRLGFRIPAHTAVDRRIRSIDRRTASLSLAHAPVDLPVEDPAAEDPTAEDPAVRAASFDAGLSSSATVHGESSGPSDVAALQATIDAHIARYEQDRQDIFARFDRLEDLIRSKFPRGDLS